MDSPPKILDDFGTIPLSTTPSKSMTCTHPWACIFLALIRKKGFVPPPPFV